MGLMFLIFLAALLLIVLAAWSVCQTKSARQDRLDSLRIVKMKRDRGEISETEYRRIREILKEDIPKTK